MLLANGGYFGLAETKKTVTISAQDTWSETFSVAGPAGGIAYLPIRIKVLSGTPVVTVQLKGAGEANTEWQDYGDTAGVANDLKIKLVDYVPVASGFDYRFGVKTGALGAGSVKITYGQ